MVSNETGVHWPSLVLLAIVLAGVIFVFPLTLDFPLLDPDEGLHAAIAQEMVERGDWLTPTFLGQPFLDKPIFYFWAQALSLRLLGSSEAAVRLPGLMFGLLGAATTGLLGWRMFDRATGLIASILYATTILPAALTQAASHDVALIPWINLALWLLWESGRTRGKAKAATAVAAGAGVFLSLSILTKGFVGLAIVGLAYGGYLLTARYRRNTADAPSGGRSATVILAGGAAALLVAVLVALPWYALAETQNPGYLRYFFLDRHLLGLVTASQPHSNQPWWYYLPILLGGGLPWISYLPAALRTRMTDRKDNHAAGLLWWWLIGWTCLLMAARSKLATYLWPVFPPMTILVAAVWARLLDGSLGLAALKSFAQTFIWSSWAGPIVLPAAVLAVEATFAVRLNWPIWVAVGLAAAMAPLPLLPWYAGWRQASLAAATLSLAVQFAAVMTMVLPPVAEIFSARDLADHFNRLGQLPPRLLVAEQRIGSLVFYLEPQLRGRLKEGQIESLSPDQLPEWHPGDVIALPERKLSRASEYLDLEGRGYESVGHYRLYHVTSDANVLPSERTRSAAGRPSGTTGPPEIRQPHPPARR